MLIDSLLATGFSIYDARFSLLEKFHLVLSENGYWRPAHDLLAVEAMMQLLWPDSVERRNWKQNLSLWAKDFAEFCRGDQTISSDKMLEIARRTFIYRDNIELLGTERSANRSFAQLLDDIPSQMGKADVLRTLTELFPDEAHFWAHLGRFYALELKDYAKALDAINEALIINESDHVLYHMKGMALRYQVYEMIGQQEPIEQVESIASAASESFENARKLAPDDEHGYISEVQMIARVLDYAGRDYPDGVMAFLKLPRVAPYLREGLEKSEYLLEQVRRNREGEGASPYEEACRGRLDSLYGDHGQALNIFNGLLGNPNVYKPSIRRQIIWTHLARRNRSWDSLTPDEIQKISGMLEENLYEEPNNDHNLRLWLKAVRKEQYPPNLDSVIERVSYWKANSGSLDASYYLYVLYALKALKGSVLSKDDTIRYLDECRYIARFRRNRTKSFEWLGQGSDLHSLVHHSELGDWDREQDFWEDPKKLVRITGRISRIDAPQAGQIEVEGGLLAFYVPAKAGGYSQDRLNRLVSFYLGFSYDGLRCWEVRDIE